MSIFRARKCSSLRAVKHSFCAHVSRDASGSVVARKWNSAGFFETAAEVTSAVGHAIPSAAVPQVASQRKATKKTKRSKTRSGSPAPSPRAPNDAAGAPQSHDGYRSEGPAAPLSTPVPKPPGPSRPNVARGPTSAAGDRFAWSAFQSSPAPDALPPPPTWSQDDERSEDSGSIASQGRSHLTQGRSPGRTRAAAVASGGAGMSVLQALFNKAAGSPLSPALPAAAPEVATPAKSTPITPPLLPPAPVIAVTNGSHRGASILSLPLTPSSVGPKKEGAAASSAAVAQSAPQTPVLSAAAPASSVPASTMAPMVLAIFAAQRNSGPAAVTSLPEAVAPAASASAATETSSPAAMATPVSIDVQRLFASATKHARPATDSLAGPSPEVGSAGVSQQRVPLAAGTSAASAAATLQSVAAASHRSGRGLLSPSQAGASAIGKVSPVAATLGSSPASASASAATTVLPTSPLSLSALSGELHAVQAAAVTSDALTLPSAQTQHGDAVGGPAVAPAAPAAADDLSRAYMAGMQAAMLQQQQQQQIQAMAMAMAFQQQQQQQQRQLYLQAQAQQQLYFQAMQQRPGFFPAHVNPGLLPSPGAPQLPSPQQPQHWAPSSSEGLTDVRGVPSAPHLTAALAPPAALPPGMPTSGPFIVAAPTAPAPTAPLGPGNPVTSGGMRALDASLLPPRHQPKILLQPKDAAPSAVTTRPVPVSTAAPVSASVGTNELAARRPDSAPLTPSAVKSTGAVADAASPSPIAKATPSRPATGGAALFLAPSQAMRRKA